MKIKKFKFSFKHFFHPKIKHPGMIMLAFIEIALIVTITYIYTSQQEANRNLQNRLQEITDSQTNFNQNFSNTLFKDHLEITHAEKIEFDLKLLQNEIDEYKNEEDNAENVEVIEIYEKYDQLAEKLERNNDANLEIINIEDLKTEIGTLLVDKNFADINTKLDENINNLDTDYKDYIDSLKPPAPSSYEGYNYTSVHTDKGTFNVSLIKTPMNSVNVKTVSAHDGSCGNNCDTKPLAQYVQENGGFAGMNGTYFCPPDYSNCGGKVNSFDYAFYDSNQGKWENKDALTWFKTGLITFNGSSANFYKKSSEYGGGGVTAGISNYPSLVKDTNVVIDNDDLTSYQKDVRGPRGAIGLGGENLYLAIIYNATVPEAAHVMRALGVKHALNLDGGGSSAMYINGGYVVGPGRSLPNAIVLVR